MVVKYEITLVNGVKTIIESIECNEYFFVEQVRNYSKNDNFEKDINGVYIRYRDITTIKQIK